MKYSFLLSICAIIIVITIGIFVYLNYSKTIKESFENTTIQVTDNKKYNTVNFITKIEIVNKKNFSNSNNYIYMGPILIYDENGNNIAKDNVIINSITTFKGLYPDRSLIWGQNNKRNLEDALNNKKLVPDFQKNIEESCTNSLVNPETVTIEFFDFENRQKTFKNISAIEFFYGKDKKYHQMNNMKILLYSGSQIKKICRFPSNCTSNDIHKVFLVDNNSKISINNTYQLMLDPFYTKKILSIPNVQSIRIQNPYIVNIPAIFFYDENGSKFPNSQSQNDLYISIEYEKTKNNSNPFQTGDYSKDNTAEIAFKISYETKLPLYLEGESRISNRNLYNSYIQDYNFIKAIGNLLKTGSHTDKNIKPAIWQYNFNNISNISAIEFFYKTDGNIDGLNNTEIFLLSDKPKFTINKNVASPLIKADDPNVLATYKLSSTDKYIHFVFTIDKPENIYTAEFNNLSYEPSFKNSFKQMILKNNSPVNTLPIIPSTTQKQIIEKDYIIKNGNIIYVNSNSDIEKNIIYNKDNLIGIDGLSFTNKEFKISVNDKYMKPPTRIQQRGTSTYKSEDLSALCNIYFIKNDGTEVQANSSGGTQSQIYYRTTDISKYDQNQIDKNIKYKNVVAIKFKDISINDLIMINNSKITALKLGNYSTSSNSHKFLYLSTWTLKFTEDDYYSMKGDKVNIILTLTTPTISEITPTSTQSTPTSTQSTSSFKNIERFINEIDNNTTTTTGQTTNTTGQTTTTSGQTTTTTAQLNMMATMLNDILSLYPGMSPEQATKLIDSGIDVNSLLTGINDNGNLITSDGIKMDSSFAGPALNMMQKNFSGSSNILSPVAYINQKRQEKFNNVMSPHLYYESFTNDSRNTNNTNSTNSTKPNTNNNDTPQDLKKQYYSF